MVLSHSKRTSTAIFLLSLVVLELIFVCDHIKQAEAMMKKKKLMKKLKKLMPILQILSLLKKKKPTIIPLPIPMYAIHSLYPFA